MPVQIIKILAQAVAITAFSAVVAVSTNSLRKDGIPLVAATPYEIFAECKDSSATTEALKADTLSSASVQKIYVDARPKTAFEEEHIEGALNIPYSALFGASEGDIEKVRAARRQHPKARIVVYGIFNDSENGGGGVDFAMPLADQLTESGLDDVMHVVGGIDTLKQSGVRTVKGE